MIWSLIACVRSPMPEMSSPAVEVRITENRWVEDGLLLVIGTRAIAEGTILTEVTVILNEEPSSNRMMIPLNSWEWTENRFLLPLETEGILLEGWVGHQQPEGKQPFSLISPFGHQHPHIPMAEDSWVDEPFRFTTSSDYMDDFLSADDNTLSFIDTKSQSLQGSTWHIVSYLDSNQAIPSDQNASIHFDNDGGLSIRSSCTLFVGSYVEQNNRITVRLQDQDTAPCDDKKGTVEQHILRLINGAPSYSIEEARLILSAGELQITAVASEQGP